MPLISTPNPVLSSLSPHTTNHTAFAPHYSYKKGLLIDKHRRHPVVSFSTKKTPEAGDKDDGRGALETILKLYTDLKDQSPEEPLESKEDEFSWFGDFLPFLLYFDRKKQMLALLASFMAFIGRNIEFVIKPTSKQGMQVGFQWNIEWKGIHIPLGKSSSIHMSHVYKGTMLVRNAKVMLEPLVHIKPLKLKLEKILLPTLDSIAPNGLLKEKKRAAFLYFFLSLLFMAMSLILWRNTGV